jgi:hypothetical protein
VLLSDDNHRRLLPKIPAASSLVQPALRRKLALSYYAKLLQAFTYGTKLPGGAGRAMIPHKVKYEKNRIVASNFFCEKLSG